MRSFDALHIYNYHLSSGGMLYAPKMKLCNQALEQYKWQYF